MSRNHAAHFVLSSALTSSQRQQNGAQGEKGKGLGVGREKIIVVVVVVIWLLPP